MKNKLLNYKTLFIAIPDPLKKQIFIRLGSALIFLLLFILVLYTMSGWMIIVPFVCLMIYGVISAVLLFFRAIAGKYVIIRGLCVDVSATPIRKRSKSILVQTDEHMVRVMMKQRTKRIPAGVQLEIYLADNTQVYEKDGAKLLYAYLAVDVMSATISPRP